MHSPGNPVTLSPNKPPTQTVLALGREKTPNSSSSRGENAGLRKENTTRIPFTPSAGAAAARLSPGGTARVVFFGTFRSTFREFHSSDRTARQSGELISSFCFNNYTAGNELGP